MVLFQLHSMGSDFRAGNNKDDVEGRPYRSHLQPACLSCRRRKSRCKTRDSSTEKCIMCQAHGTDCVFPLAPVGGRSLRTRSKSPRKAVRARQNRLARTGVTSHSGAHSVHPGAPVSDGFRPELSPRALRVPADNVQITYSHNENREDVHLVGISTETEDDNSHIVSPAVADDNDVLESYLSTIPNSRRRYMNRSGAGMNQRHRPVLFNTVRRRPLGVSANQSVAAAKCEVIERCIEPCLDVVDLFLTQANICFPVFDQASFRNVYMTQKDKISPALLSCLYANALIYWQNSSKSSGSRCPDVRFIWNQANEALHSELFLSPGISTIIAIILNVAGRPSTSMFGNGGMLGMAVALCNALGLNRDPTHWDISPSEKRLRIRIWWLVLVHDRWCSLAYGTPLQIQRAQYDVPFPTMADLCGPEASTSERKAASVFISLTTLTEVLSRYLGHIYNISRDPPESNTSTVDLELLLSEWEESLDGDIRRMILRGTHLNSPGAANFRLAYLAVKLLLRRIQLDLDKDASRIEDVASQPYMQAQRAAEEIVFFVQELDESQLYGFWLPANAFTLTSATTFLLRGALRAENPNRSAPFSIARDMINTLRSHRERFSWDLADNCLASCADIGEKLGSVDAGIDILVPSFPDFQEGLINLDAAVLDDLFSGFAGLENGIETQF